MPKVAQERTSAFREQWVATFALMLVWFGGLFEVATFLLHRYQPVVLADFGHFAAWLGLSLAVVLGARIGLLAKYILAALLVASVASLFSIGFIGPTAPILMLGPLATAILFGPLAGTATVILAVGLFSLAAYLHVQGRIDTVPFMADQFGAWILTIVAFSIVAVSISSLVNHLLRDLERVSREFEDARKGLVTAGELRIAAENARDASLRFRSESRSVEALGVVAGGVVHDLRNMAQVIRTWADEIARTESVGTAAEASHGIVESCERLNHLSVEVLALGNNTAPSKSEMSLGESLPRAARALRRFLREDIRIVVDSDIPRGLPLLPISAVDLVHVVLEAAAAMNVTTLGSGTLIVSAPRAVIEGGPTPLEGTTRFPALISLELQRDGNVKSTREWLATKIDLKSGVELAHTSLARTVLWCPEKDTALIAFDLYPEHNPTSVSRISLYRGALDA